MRVLSEEKVKVLVDRNGWSQALARGYMDGQTLRRRGETPSRYALVGIDDYCLGFRAGYYDRQLHGARRDEPLQDSPLLQLSGAHAR
jgi:hypothetical protein